MAFYSLWFTSLVCLAFPLPLPEEESLMHEVPGFLHPLRLFRTLRPINVSWNKKIFCWLCFASSEYCVYSMYPETRKFFNDNVSPLRNTASNQCILKQESFFWQCFASSEHCVYSMYPETRSFLLPMFRIFGVIRTLKGIDRSFELRCEIKLNRFVMTNWRLGNFFYFILKGQYHKISKKPKNAA